MGTEVGKAEKWFLSVYPVHTWWSLSARHHLLKNGWTKLAISFIRHGTYEWKIVAYMSSPSIYTSLHAPVLHLPCACWVVLEKRPLEHFTYLGDRLCYRGGLYYVQE